MAANIYVIGGDNTAPGSYKIGYSAGDIGDVVKQYKTSLVNPKIYYFVWCADAHHAKQDILSGLNYWRMVDGCRPTDWLNLAPEHIITAANRAIPPHNNKPRNTHTKTLPKSRKSSRRLKYKVIDLINDPVEQGSEVEAMDVETGPEWTC